MKPSVVFFMMDQLSAKWFEAALGGVCPTPHFDRLRTMGVTFRNAITSNPVCCPARATLATGLTTRGHGVLENGYALDPKLPTFMQALQKSGWRTGAFGKVHLYPHFAGLYPDYKPFGFDATHITEDPRGGDWLDGVESEHPEHYEAALATIWPVAILDFAAYGPKKVNLRERIEKIRSNFQWATPDFPNNTPGAYTLPFPEEVSQTNWITSRALEFIRGTRADRPLFAHISYVQPHGPKCPPAECVECVDASRIPEPAPAEWLTDPHAPKYFDQHRHMTGKVPSEHWRYYRQLYFADIVHLDRQLGRVLETLEETGRLGNTYVILVADHGDLLEDHGFNGKEERHYDACIRVPLIVAGPGLKKGVARDEMVQLEDLCPTALDAAAEKMPAMPKEGPYLKMGAEEIPALPGRSLLPLCRGETAPDWRPAAYCESYNGIWSVALGDWARTIRTQEFRYTFYPNNRGDQLFDLRSDPDEQCNLAADPSRAKIRQELRDQLLELIVRQDYPKTRRDLFALGVH
ncbi:MAG TPA: sulfatase-like hydrolase/transferase [Sumerlaeia bacterium]|nr:sulfatase-like hydrolase/transferase [Sumerlaeia bacterium]